MILVRRQEDHFDEDDVGESFLRSDQPRPRGAFGGRDVNGDDLMVVCTDVGLGTDFDVFDSQIVALCGLPTERACPAPVDAAQSEAAFAVHGDQRVGPHTVECGWLPNPPWPAEPGPRQRQFSHRDQWFARAFD